MWFRLCQRKHAESFKPLIACLHIGLPNQTHAFTHMLLATKNILTLSNDL